MKLYSEAHGTNEKRIIYLTDAIPTAAEGQSLETLTEKCVASNIFVTYIGIGGDFNSELVEKLMKFRGSNYYTVTSAKEFEESMGEHFDHMVTPIVMDLRLHVDVQQWTIEKIYGAPKSSNIAAGDILKVPSLFPTTTKKTGEAKGGVILLKMKRKENTSASVPLVITASWQNKQSVPDSTVASIDVTSLSKKEEFYQTPGIRKAVMLVHYANLLWSWTDSVSDKKADAQFVEGFRKKIKEMVAHIENEVDVLEDQTLENELKILHEIQQWTDQQLSS